MTRSKMWKRAKEMADKTPTERNRYVDLLRAVSISAVVLGHWIMAAPYFEQGSPHMVHLLEIQPWSRWLTWVFQVMPIFFFVGGFSNGVSWDSLRRRNGTYSSWLESRLRRLLGPVIPLILLWCVLGAAGNFLGVHPEMIGIGSQVSLIPVWFLAIYFFIVMLVPWTRRAWHRFGYASVIVPALLAVLGDWVFFYFNFKWLAWFNFLFIWSAVHQLGYAWQAKRLGGLTISLSMAIAGAAALVSLTVFGPYPLSLVGVPGQEISNTSPPKLPILALAIAQIGILLSLEGPMRKWLAGGKAWTATVLVNGIIMPVYLWHSTVMILIIGGLFLIAPGLLGAQPGSEHWWMMRPVWVLVYFVAMIMLLPVFLWLEKASGTTRPRSTPTPAIILGAAAICLGLALLAGSGIAGDGPLGLNFIACLLPIGGAVLITVLGKAKANGD
ncbi:MAG: acyltransferase [Gammaproteobacteria bacterium]